MGVIVVGNGLFKANAAQHGARASTKATTPKIDSAFTLYYMAVNIGAFVSQSLTPIVREHCGWHWAFAVCCFGLVLGLAQFFFQRRYVDHIGSTPDYQPVRWRRLWAVVGRHARGFGLDRAHHPAPERRARASSG